MTQSYKCSYEQLSDIRYTLHEFCCMTLNMSNLDECATNNGMYLVLAMSISMNGFGCTMDCTGCTRYGIHFQSIIGIAIYYYHRSTHITRVPFSIDYVSLNCFDRLHFSGSILQIQIRLHILHPILQYNMISPTRLINPDTELCIPPLRICRRISPLSSVENLIQAGANNMM